MRELLHASNISSKTLRTSFGGVDVAVPRDRKGEFEPRPLEPVYGVVFLDAIHFHVRREGSSP